MVRPTGAAPEDGDDRMNQDDGLQRQSTQLFGQLVHVPTGTVRSPATIPSDAQLLAGLRHRRGPLVPGLLALFWAAWAVQRAVQGDLWLAAGTAAAALAWSVAWWASPAPRVWGVTADALLVRRGRRTRPIARTGLQDVQPRQTGHTGYGLELRLHDAEPVELAGTALRWSVVDAQAAALRRWAGLPPVS